VPSAGGQTGISSSAGTSVLSSLGTIRLPMPNQMVDHQDIVYAVEELGLVAGSALAKFQQSGGSYASALGGAAGGGLIGAAQNLGNAIPGTNGQGFNVLLQTQGLSVNPFLSVMFKSPAFKKHAFKWKLSPENEQESGDLGTIIDTFRFNQLPSASAAFSGALLAYPNVVQISVAGSGPPGTGAMFSYTFKPAVIESFASNFAPNGQASMFGTTGAPTEVEINMSLLEIEYWLQNDYATNPTTTGAASAATVETNINNFLALWKTPPSSNTATAPAEFVPPPNPF